MTKAALYARVSSDAQKHEGTIKSQVLELKRQITAAGHVLIKEYIDDGLSGTQLDRPGLDQMRRDIKTDVFEAIYFLDTDRIARDVAYQSIILSELLKHGKQIIIKGRDYVHNPENKFAVTVLGAVAELERAKIIERTTRGRLHRLRLGELSSNGYRIYGYEYVKRTPTAPATLRINEEQAAVVRDIFAMFASGRLGLVTICRTLEERSIPTYRGTGRWDNDRIKSMLLNETYAGVRYFNRLTTDLSAAPVGAKRIHGRFVYRDQKEWIPVCVPAIVSRDLFDTVQERLRRHDERYCRPITHYLLGGLVQCGFCGARASSSRGWHRVRRPSGTISVYHRAEYRCNRRARENMRDRSRIKRCRNSSISTHILEEKVFDMIRDIMLDPGRLRQSMDVDALHDRRTGRKLSHLVEEITRLESESYSSTAMRSMRSRKASTSPPIASLTGARKSSRAARPT
jgi:site-specific DNA recombinase